MIGGVECGTKAPCQGRNLRGGKGRNPIISAKNREKFAYIRDFS